MHVIFFYRKRVIPALLLCNQMKNNLFTLVPSLDGQPELTRVNLICCHLNILKKN